MLLSALCPRWLCSLRCRQQWWLAADCFIWRQLLRRRLWRHVSLAPEGSAVLAALKAPPQQRPTLQRLREQRQAGAVLPLLAVWAAGENSVDRRLRLVRFLRARRSLCCARVAEVLLLLVQARTTQVSRRQTAKFGRSSTPSGGARCARVCCVRRPSIGFQQPVVASLSIRSPPNPLQVHIQ